MNLRGHHLLCLLGFQGHGYSPSFIQKMRDLAPDYRDIEQDPYIFINPYTDEICKKCPALNGSRCTSFAQVDQTIRQMDKRILQQLELEEGKRYRKSEVFKRIVQRIEPADLHSLCKGCKWLKYGVCEQGIKDLKEKTSVPSKP